GNYHLEITIEERLIECEVDSTVQPEGVVCTNPSPEVRFSEDSIVVVLDYDKPGTVVGLRVVDQEGVIWDGAVATQQEHPPQEDGCDCTYGLGEVQLEVGQL
ncbi:MAG: hypothetical protein KC431_01475, partial [Myxococcales bacterium]|nr:hypothetical protein [Myxococcales bacterium]